MSIVNATELQLTVPAGWYDGSVSVFEDDETMDSGVVVVIRRAPLRGNVDTYVERDVAEVRRSLARCEITSREPGELAGSKVTLVTLRWQHRDTAMLQTLVYGSVRPGRVFRVAIGGREDRQARYVAAVKQLFASAKRIEAAK